MKKLLMSGFLAMLLVTVTACGGGGGGNSTANTDPNATAAGTPAGDTTQITLPVSGGDRTLVSSDKKLTIQFPDNVFDKETTVTVTPITNNAHSGVGNAYRINAGGATLKQPVTLTFNYPKDQMTGVQGVAYQDSNGLWMLLPGVATDETNEKLSVTTTHFSDFSPLKGFRLSPFEATLGINGTMTFTVMLCLSDTIVKNGVPHEGGLVNKCKPADLPESSWPITWSASAGTISPVDNATATYTAPSSVPSKNPVAVTAVIRGTKKLVSNVTIVGESKGNGKFHSESKLGDGTIVIDSTDVTLAWEKSGTTHEGDPFDIYIIGGSVENKTTSFIMPMPNKQKTTCTLADNSIKQIPDHTRLLIVKSSPPVAVWLYSDMWKYNCSDMGTIPVSAVAGSFGSINRGSWEVPGNAVEINDVKNPKGSFTTSDTNGVFSGDWDFKINP